jgi:hypothetical protein
MIRKALATATAAEQALIRKRRQRTISDPVTNRSDTLKRMRELAVIGAMTSSSA